jgi:hypothetical protein
MAKKYTADTFEGAVTGNVTGSASLNVLKAGDTMTGNLKIQKNTPVFELNSNSIYPYGRIEFAGTTSQPFEIVGQSNPGGVSLALRAQPTSTMADAFAIKTASGSAYNYSAVPLRIGADASSNELDDYEEGSYNVQFRVGSTNYGSSNWVSGGGLAWTDNSQYVKVGRRVTLFFDLQYRGIPTAISSSTADLYLTNLPFTMAHGGGGNISFSWYNRNANSSANPQNLGGATRLTPDGTNQATQINLEHLEFSSYWNAWFVSSMGTNYLPTSPPGGNIYMYGQFTYFTDN